MTDGESLWTLASPRPDDAHSDSWKTHSGRSGQAEQRLLTTLYLFVPNFNQALLEIRTKRENENSTEYLELNPECLFV